MKFKAKIANFWYYHKWKVIIGSFLSIFLGLCIVQLFQKEEYDVRFVYCGPQYLAEEDSQAMMTAFERLMAKDYDGDGEKNALLIDVIVMSDEQIVERREEAKKNDVAFMYDVSSRNSLLMRVSSYLSTGEALIGLFDNYVYQGLKEEGAFVPLADVLGYTPEYAIDEYSVYFKDTDFAKSQGAFSALPEDTILCIKTIPLLYKTDTQKRVYNDHLDYFRRIFEFRVD